MVPLHRCELRQGSAAKFMPASYLATSLPTCAVLGLVSCPSVCHQKELPVHLSCLAAPLLHLLLSADEASQPFPPSADAEASHSTVALGPLGNRDSLWYDLGKCQACC